MLHGMRLARRGGGGIYVGENPSTLRKPMYSSGQPPFTLSHTTTINQGDQTQVREVSCPLRYLDHHCYH